MATCKKTNTVAVSKKKAEDEMKVIKDLHALFGQSLHIEIIKTVAMSCNYDSNRASNLLVEMTSNIDNSTSNWRSEPRKKPQQLPPPAQFPPTPPRSSPSPQKIKIKLEPQTIRRLQTSASTGQIAAASKSKKMQEIERVVHSIQTGYKVLVLLRGLPGSGKSFLARQIVFATLGDSYYEGHILSTDDFFGDGPKYTYDPQKLSLAHEWNHTRAFKAMSQGVSPVVVDNTNTQMWEMKPYAMMAIDFGYIVEILEPDTWWCLNEKELAKRNVHNVGRSKIRDMIDRYEKNLTPSKLLCAYSLHYKFQKPPQFRVVPSLTVTKSSRPPVPIFNGTAFPQPPTAETHPSYHNKGGPVTSAMGVPATGGVKKSKSATVLSGAHLYHHFDVATFHESSPTMEIDDGMETINLMDFTDESNNYVSSTTNPITAAASSSSSGSGPMTYEAMAAASFWNAAPNPLDEILMLTEDSNFELLMPDTVCSGGTEASSKIDVSSKLYNDARNAWGLDEQAMQSWDIVSPLGSGAGENFANFNRELFTPPPDKEPAKPETRDVANSSHDISLSLYQNLLRGCADVPDGCRVVQAHNRDINAGFHRDRSRNTIAAVPKTPMMYDKGCWTGEEDDVAPPTKDRTVHIRELMDVFPKVPRSHIVDLYTKCNRDFNWTVEVLLEDNSPLLLDKADRREDEEEEAEEESYSDEDNEAKVELEGARALQAPEGAGQASTPKRRIEIKESAEAVELKRCLESKFDISHEHYSPHVLKVKQYKFGNNSPPPPPDHHHPQPSTSSAAGGASFVGASPPPPAAPASATALNDFDFDADFKCDDDSGSDNGGNSAQDGGGKFATGWVELNLGDTLVDQLEGKFRGEDMVHPSGFQPVVQMPVALARQIYLLYVESVYQQMEAQNRVLDRLVAEDEEFARKLQAQEQMAERQRQQQSSRGLAEPPPIPNLNEIMDEQVAVNLYKRDTERWKSMTADSLALTMTKRKLFDAFPHVDKNSLLEILHANDNNYDKTVEDLFLSVGEAASPDTREAIREPPLSSTTIDEMKESEKYCAQDEEEDPAPRHSATYYREKANEHLKRRQEMYQKAMSYAQRGMSEVAGFYSNLAQKETQLFERNNGWAATAFLHEHSQRLGQSGQQNDTLDLHYLYVKEALAALDVFIDKHISSMEASGTFHQDLLVITGRGKNSEGGVSRIKPAVEARLKKRFIGYVTLNPGLLKIRVYQDTLVTSRLLKTVLLD